jgi:hypothetical protein
MAIEYPAKPIFDAYVSQYPWLSPEWPGLVLYNPRYRRGMVILYGNHAGIWRTNGYVIKKLMKKYKHTLGSKVYDINDMLDIAHVMMIECKRHPGEYLAISYEDPECMIKMHQVLGLPKTVHQ